MAGSSTQRVGASPSQSSSQTGPLHAQIVSQGDASTLISDLKGITSSLDNSASYTNGIDGGADDLDILASPELQPLSLFNDLGQTRGDDDSSNEISAFDQSSTIRISSTKTSTLHHRPNELESTTRLEDEPKSPPLISTNGLLRNGKERSSNESTPSILETGSSPPTSSVAEEQPSLLSRSLLEVNQSTVAMALTPEASSLFGVLPPPSPASIDPSSAPPQASSSRRNKPRSMSTSSYGAGESTVNSLTISPMPFHHITFATPSMESSFERTPMLDDPDHMRQLADPPVKDQIDQSEASTSTQSAAADFSAVATANREHEEAVRQRDAAKAARLLEYQERMRVRMAANSNGKGKEDEVSSNRSSVNTRSTSGTNGSDSRTTVPGSNMVRGRRHSNAASTLAMAVHAAKMRTPNLKDLTILPARPPHDLAEETRFNHIVLTTHWLDDNPDEAISLAHLPEYQDLLELPPEYLGPNSLVDLSHDNLPQLPGTSNGVDASTGSNRNHVSVGTPSAYSSSAPTPPSSTSGQAHPSDAFVPWNRGSSLNFSDPSLSVPSPPVMPDSLRLTSEVLENGHLSTTKRTRLSDSGSSRGSKKRSRADGKIRSRSPTPPPFEPTGEEPTSWQVQETSCLSKTLDGHPRCYQCSPRTSDGQNCAFRGVRSFGLNDQGMIVTSPEIIDIDDTAQEQPQFVHSPNREQGDDIRTAIASSLVSTLKHELQHASLPNAVRVPRDLRMPSLCATCLAAPVSGDWLCKVCGRSACLSCFDALVQIDGAIEAGTSQLDQLTPDQTRRRKCLSAKKRSSSPERPHSHESFVPLIRSTREELLARHTEVTRWKSEHLMPSIIEAMSPEQIAASYSTDPILASERPGLVLPVSAMSSRIWQQVWARHEPIVLDGSSIDLISKWTPATFLERFGEMTLKLENHKTGERGPALASYFFGLYGQPKKDSTSWKVRDMFISEEGGMREKVPELMNAYLATIPLPDLLRPDGVLNPLSHVPLNALEPQVGPRCVFTWAGRGSTLLHMKSADHIHLLAYSSATAVDVPGSTRWDIFRYEDSDVVRTFIHDLIAKKMAKAGTTKAHHRDAHDDPLFNENVFLDASLRAELFKQTGVRPYTVWQRVGQFVIVPAGCAFQITTFDDCLGYAHEFVSKEHVARSVQIDTLARAMKRADLPNIQLASSLNWAWQSVTSSLVTNDRQSVMPVSYTTLPPLPPIPGSANVSPHAHPTYLPPLGSNLSTLTEPDSESMDVEL